VGPRAGLVAVVMRKIPSPKPGLLEPPIVQPLAQCYTAELSRLLQRCLTNRNRRRKCINKQTNKQTN